MKAALQNFFQAEFLDVIKSIALADSKASELEILKEALPRFRYRLATQSISPTYLKENLIFILYCDMLGYANELGYADAVKLTLNAVGLEEKKLV